MRVIRNVCEDFRAKWVLLRPLTLFLAPLLCLTSCGIQIRFISVPQGNENAPLWTWNLQSSSSGGHFALLSDNSPPGSGADSASYERYPLAKSEAIYVPLNDGVMTLGAGLQISVSQQGLSMPSNSNFDRVEYIDLKKKLVRRLAAHPFPGSSSSWVNPFAFRSNDGTIFLLRSP